MVELLVVIAVIAVLVGLAAGGSATALRKARIARCQSNLQQLGVAMASFVAGNGHYPGHTNPEVVGMQTNAWLWCHAIEREMTGSDEFIPARFKGTLAGSVWDCPSENHYPNGNLDYGYNEWGITSEIDQEPFGLAGKIRELAFVGFERPPRVPVRQGDVLNPSRMIALGDGVSGWQDGYFWHSSRISRERPPVPKSVLKPFDPSRHQSRLNVGFADGHVDIISLRRLFVEQTDESLSVWNRDGVPHRERLVP